MNTSIKVLEKYIAAHKEVFNEDIYHPLPGEVYRDYVGSIIHSFLCGVYGLASVNEDGWETVVSARKTELALRLKEIAAHLGKHGYGRARARVIAIRVMVCQCDYSDLDHLDAIHEMDRQFCRINRALEESHRKAFAEHAG